MIRRDAHIHLGVIDPFGELEGAALKNKRLDLHRRIHPLGPTTINDVRRHIRTENLTQACVICDDAELLARAVKELSSSAVISPVYWERNWENPQIPAFAKAIKIHPMIEGLNATPENLKAVIDIAQKMNIPVLFHSEDENLTRSRGCRMKILAIEHPEVTFVAGHAGAYGAPQFKKVSFREKYLATMMSLVREMIDAAIECPNVYLETSCLAYLEKAQLLHDATRQHPSLADKILMGSDFPLPSEDFALKIYATFAHQESALMAVGFSEDEIQKFHNNVRNVFAPLAPAEPTFRPQTVWCRAGIDLK